MLHILSLSIFLILTVFGCGPLPGMDPIQKIPRIQFPSKEDIQENRADGLQYIVGIKTPKASVAKALYRLEFNHYHSQLQRDHRSDERVVKMEFMTRTTREKDRKRSLTPIQPYKMEATLDSENSYSTSITHVEFRSKEEAREVLNEWKEQGILEFADPDWNNNLHQEEPFGNYIENFKSPNLEWGLKKIKIVEAFNFLAQQANENGLNPDKVVSNAPIIAVFDSGVDVEHPELKEAIFKNGSGGILCQNDTWGCNTTNENNRPIGMLGTNAVQPVYTATFNSPCPDSTEQKGVCIHGTHVAGIAAGTFNQTEGTGGVCPFCKILPVRVVDSSGGIKDSALIRGMLYVERFKDSGSNQLVRVLNASLGKYQRSRAVSILSRRLHHEDNVVIVGAAGNDDSGGRNYPAGFGSAIAVSSVTQTSQKSFFSNFGIWVDIAAPGSAIKSTVPGNSYENSDGTSMASPFVAGAAGLYIAYLKAINRNGEASDSATIKGALIAYADPTLYSPDTPETSYNNNYYRVPIAGQNDRVPLLGSGVLDLLAMFEADTDRRNAERLTPTKRVTSFCSLSENQNANFPLWRNLLVIFFLAAFPLFLTIIMKRT